MRETRAPRVIGSPNSARCQGAIGPPYPCSITLPWTSSPYCHVLKHAEWRVYVQRGYRMYNQVSTWATPSATEFTDKRYTHETITLLLAVVCACRSGYRKSIVPQGLWDNQSRVKKALGTRAGLDQHAKSPLTAKLCNGVQHVGTQTQSHHFAHSCCKWLPWTAP